METKRLQDYTLRNLLSLGGRLLDDLYREAFTPAIERLNGPYDGVLIEGEIVGTGKRIPLKDVNQPWFPWKGKAFFGSGSERGNGNNRFQAGSFNGGIWNFQTHLGPSAFGAGEVCHVDYGIPDNPKWMGQSIFDEMKLLHGDLYLGKGGLRVFGKDRFVFYWAIDKARRKKS